MGTCGPHVNLSILIVPHLYHSGVGSHLGQDKCHELIKVITPAGSVTAIDTRSESHQSHAIVLNEQRCNNHALFVHQLARSLHRQVVGIMHLESDGILHAGHQITALRVEIH